MSSIPTRKGPRKRGSARHLPLAQSKMKTELREEAEFDCTPVELQRNQQYVRVETCRGGMEIRVDVGQAVELVDEKADLYRTTGLAVIDMWAESEPDMGGLLVRMAPDRATAPVDAVIGVAEALLHAAKEAKRRGLFPSAM